MFNKLQRQEYYQALINKDDRYENIFFVAVKITRVFCRLTCPARKPKFEIVNFIKLLKKLGILHIDLVSVASSFTYLAKLQV
ncbi:MULTISPECIES: Ada metal-binding domain-containing protein [spotted fever group]|uniref:Ada DNA repair metal-binding domain-containing protein n=1 Tax=Rickettsia philipii (strain 364D) TaxID=481009 RepID=H6PUF0_RICP3|nr:Ada metal-binding domain-containing protein [Rickettsia philipii]AFB26497.1 hypothetical protein RSA_04810 [Rickettsia philipii str. 364D]